MIDGDDDKKNKKKNKQTPQTTIQHFILVFPFLFSPSPPPLPTFQRESRRLQNHHSRENNSSWQLAEEVRGVSRGLQTLEKRTFRSEDLLHRLEGRLSKVIADYDRVKDAVMDLKVGTCRQRLYLILSKLSCFWCCFMYK